METNVIATIRSFFLILAMLILIGFVATLLASMADVKRYLRVRRM